jgi:ABC-type glycerol-3-phosphate transport system permease component
MRLPAFAPSRRASRRLGGFVQQALLLAASAIALFPLWFMAWTAIRSSDDYFRAPLGLPQSVHWDNFARAFGENIGRWVINSTIVTAGSVLLVTIVCVPAAYAFVRLPFRGSAHLLRFFVFLMVIPPIVMLLPLFELMNRLGRINHFDSVIVAYAGLMFPFSVFMMVRYIEAIPQELHEAALVEGASHLRILWTIVVPLVAPALLTLGIVNALWAWNELLIAVVMLQKEDARTLQAGLALLKGKNTIDIPLVMAGATISAIPLLLLYLFGQRLFMSGLLAGSVKE